MALRMVGMSPPVEIHDGVGTVLDRILQLVELVVDMGSGGRVAYIGVDLAFGRYTDAHGLKRGMVDVGGNDESAASNFVANEIDGKVFALGDVLHLRSDQALASVEHLGANRIVFTGANPLIAIHALIIGVGFGSGLLWSPCCKNCLAHLFC